jgi:LPPG:FO 2-phospho-L-lactate transferase
MITVISGGTGTPKLIRGLSKVIDERDLSVIVNTAEDQWLPHGYFSPDVDTVVYTLKGVIDDSTWHGVRGDTFSTHAALKKFGSSEYLRIGDMDRALHIWRGERMRAGEKLSHITKKHCSFLGVQANVYPMSDDLVQTAIITHEGDLGLHEFWVKKRGEPDVEGVRFDGMDEANACEEAVRAIEDAERVIIGPSNPVTSIYPIISLPEINKALKKGRGKVIAVSPIVGESAFSGPAEKLMKAFGIEVNARGVAEFYRNFIATLVVDSSEDLEGASGVAIVKSDIVMDTILKSEALSDFILKVDL